MLPREEAIEPQFIFPPRLANAKHELRMLYEWSALVPRFNNSLRDVDASSRQHPKTVVHPMRIIVCEISRYAIRCFNNWFFISLLSAAVFIYTVVWLHKRARHSYRDNV